MATATDNLTVLSECPPDTAHECLTCGNPILPVARATVLHKTTCLKCGERDARAVKHCIVPMPKSNYIVVTDPSLLIGLNSSHKGARA
jgi:hypothetical protein